jgi:hypothetical protein
MAGTSTANDKIQSKLGNFPDSLLSDKHLIFHLSTGLIIFGSFTYSTIHLSIYGNFFTTQDSRWRLFLFNFSSSIRRLL